MSQNKVTTGIWIFALIWFGQLVSTIGTGLTNFALSVWVYQRTGSATQLTLVYLCGSLPSVLVLPFAGAFADRWGRRRAMLFSNFGAGLSTLPIALLLFAGNLEVWHIYVIVFLRSVFIVFLNPAYTAATASLIPKQHYGRASGMMQASQATGQIIPPLLAGLLTVTIGIRNIILIDVCTYLFTLILLLLIRLPEIGKSDEQRVEKEPLLRDVLQGWTYITKKPGLLALLFYFTTINFVMGVAQALFTPMLLSFTSAQALGTVLSISGVGSLIGSIVMSVWGGPKNRVQGALGFGVLVGISLTLAGLRPSVPLIAAAMFAMFFFVPFVNGCSEAIWLSKTMPHLQGRVFAIRRMIGFSCIPLAYLVAGWLAENLFEPMVAAGGPLSGAVGRIIGEGPGRGIGLLYITAGAITLLAPLIAYLYPRLRCVENELTDAVIGESEAPSRV